MDIFFDSFINAKKPLTTEINAGIIALAKDKFKVKVSFDEENPYGDDMLDGLMDLSVDLNSSVVSNNSNHFESRISYKIAKKTYDSAMK